MTEAMRARLAELEAEMDAGGRLERELAGRLEEVRRDLLRISGAVQVLRELADAEAPAARAAA